MADPMEVVPPSKSLNVDMLSTQNLSEMDEEDLYTMMKFLQQQLEFVDIQEEYVKDEHKNLKRDTGDDSSHPGHPILEMLSITSGPDTGSKILVTTRHIQLLQREGAHDQTLRMEGLGDDDSWALFREFAFKGDDTI
ncbi:unnamed protein product [Calypogeia fissa]